MKLVGGALVLIGVVAGQAEARHDEGVVRTHEGPVRGTAAGPLRSFLGIPYAAPPVGDQRWRPPQPVARWHEPLDATTFRGHCAQPPSPFGMATTNEDCLYLNVYTPRDRHAHRDFFSHGHAVMVWIHGGALVTGESDDYDPARLVSDGDVVVVTINYRLGALGYLAHPALTAESPDGASGNYGLMDQQAALAWVQRNIRGFGGDPRRVTIFGESAGGLSVHVQLASPRAAGLFDRAIVQSGAYQLNQASLATAETRGQAFAAASGCADQTAACLRALPAATLLANPAARAIAAPVIDGKVLTQSIASAFASGDFNRVPVIGGSTHDEWRLFVALDELVAGPVTAQTYAAAIAATLGVPLAATPIFIARYPLDAFPSPPEALAALGTDAIFACNARRALGLLAPHVLTWAYEFNDDEAPQRFLPPVSFPTGAYHASEIQYLFDLPITVPAPPLDEDQQRLAGAMVGYWTTFARTGQPSWFGRPFWPLYRPSTERVLSLEPPRPRVITDFAADHQCAFWASLGGS